MTTPTFDHRMSSDTHIHLCNTLTDQMGPGDCDHTLTRTRRILADLSPERVEPALAWLREHGGHCDCEVILNTIPWDDLSDASEIECPY